MALKISVIFTIFYLSSALGQFYEDRRCRCICPSPSAILNQTIKNDRTLYIGLVPANLCNCDEVVLPKLSDDIRIHASIICPRCECKFETRNTTIIMIVVMLVVWMLTLLLTYLAFLMLLDPFFIRHRNEYCRRDNNTEESASLLMQEGGPED